MILSTVPPELSEIKTKLCIAPNTAWLNFGLWLAGQILERKNAFNPLIRFFKALYTAVLAL